MFEHHPAVSQYGQPFLPGSRLADGVRQQDLHGNVTCPRVVFPQQLGHEGVEPLVQLVRQQKMMGRQDMAASDPQDHAGGVLSIASKADQVAITLDARNGSATAGGPVEFGDEITQVGGILEAEVDRACLHVIPKFLHNLMGGAGQEPDHPLDLFAVSLLGVVINTGGAAAPDLPVQTSAFYGLAGKIKMAGTNLEGPGGELQGFPHGPHSREGSEIAGFFFY